MLGNLLKPAWQSESAEKRRLAVLKMSVEESANQTIFEQLALDDPDQQVRLACVQQLQVVASVFKVYQLQHDEPTKCAAKAKFCDLIGTNNNLSEAQCETLLSEHKDASVLVAQYSPHANLRIRLLDALSQTEQAEAIAEIQYADTRLHIAEQLNLIEALEIARRNLKGKDKRSEKVIRAKLETYRAQQKVVSEVNKRALELGEQMEFIANHPEWRSEFKAKYLLYKQRWAALESGVGNDLIDAMAKRFNAAANTAQLKVEQQTALENAEHNQDQVVNKLERYCARLAPLSLLELADERLSINAVLGEALDTWLESIEVVAPNASIAKKMSNAQQALRSLSGLIESTSKEELDLTVLAANLKRLSWHASYTELSAKAEATELLKTRRLQDSEQRQQQKENLDSLHKRINRLLGTSNKGNIKQARQELNATTKAASQYAGKERKILDERLAMAGDIVTKMRDWQNFAIEPKLLELCGAMEQLVNSKFHPDKLAQEISKLQNSWKNLGTTEVSEEHWQRFKAAADLAYAPCAVFFEQRRTTQKENLAKREPLLARMQAVLDDTDWDDTPDYKNVENSLRNIANDWRKIKDVDRKAGQKQWDKLSAIRALIYQKLDVVYDANIEKKQQIIAQVNAIADGEVNDQSLDKLKLFQSRWQQVGVTRRQQDQAAWKHFKAAGDRVYENVTAQRNEKRAIEDQQIGAYKGIIKDIHSLAKSATNLAEADPKFEELTERYASLPALPKNLPEKLIERLENDFRRAGEAYSQAHDRLIQASKDEVINTLIKKAELCSQLELAVTKEDASRISELEAALTQIEIADKALDKRFETRLNAAKDINKSAASQARQLLCIELEIALDAPSPEYDKALRMQIQLERMKETGIGQITSQQSSAINDLKLDWLCLPGAEPKLQAQLEQRFKTLISKN